MLTLSLSRITPAASQYASLRSNVASNRPVLAAGSVLRQSKQYVTCRTAAKSPVTSVDTLKRKRTKPKSSQSRCKRSVCRYSADIVWRIPSSQTLSIRVLQSSTRISSLSLQCNVSFKQVNTSHCHHTSLDKGPLLASTRVVEEAVPVESVAGRAGHVPGVPKVIGAVRTRQKSVSLAQREHTCTRHVHAGVKVDAEPRAPGGRRALALLRGALGDKRGNGEQGGGREAHGVLSVLVGRCWSGGESRVRGVQCAVPRRPSLNTASPAGSDSSASASAGDSSPSAPSLVTALGPPAAGVGARWTAAASSGRALMAGSLLLRDPAQPADCHLHGASRGPGPPSDGSGACAMGCTLLEAVLLLYALGDEPRLLASHQQTLPRRSGGGAPRESGSNYDAAGPLFA